MVMLAHEIQNIRFLIVCFVLFCFVLFLSSLELEMDMLLLPTNSCVTGEFNLHGSLKIAP